MVEILCFIPTGRFLLEKKLDGNAHIDEWFLKDFKHQQWDLQQNIGIKSSELGLLNPKDNIF